MDTHPTIAFYEAFLSESEEVCLRLGQVCVLAPAAPDTPSIARASSQIRSMGKEVSSTYAFNRELDNECTSDLSWDDFNTQVLSRRSEYKGIFIQESTIPWNAPLYQRPQHIACAFGRLGYLVLYETVNWSDDTINGVREVDQNVWTTTCSQVDAIEGAVCSFYSTDFTIRPQMISKRRGIQKIIYEYIDHIDPKISGDAENIRRLVALKDFAFGGGADYIVASARKLEAEVVEAVGRDKVILAQNGVDIRHYRNPIHQSTPLPENLVLFKNKYFNISRLFWRACSMAVV